MDIRYEGCNSKCIMKCNKYIESIHPIKKKSKDGEIEIENLKVFTCLHWKTCTNR